MGGAVQNARPVNSGTRGERSKGKSVCRLGLARLNLNALPETNEIKFKQQDVRKRTCICIPRHDGHET